MPLEDSGGEVTDAMSTPSRILGLSYCSLDTHSVLCLELDDQKEANTIINLARCSVTDFGTFGQFSDTFHSI